MRSSYSIFLVFSIIFLFFLTFSSSTKRRHSRDIGEVTHESRQDLQYAVICDAGSSGTRMFVYTFSKPVKTGLINVKPHFFNGQAVVKKVTPGISTFGDYPEKVLEYIRPLIELAENTIPAGKISETPVFIYATAGMRLLPEKQQNAILNKLRKDLGTITKLKIVDENIQVIDGSWEGIYSWIALNYIRGKLRPGVKGDTDGMIEMGGASVQLAYEFISNDPVVSKDIHEINLGPNPESPTFKYQLFSTTFLGFGAHEGLKKYEAYVTQHQLPANCLASGFEKTVHVADFKVKLEGIGDWNKCLTDVGKMVRRTDVQECKTSKCYLDFMPAPAVNLTSMNLFGFSEYWYTTNSFNNGGQYNYQKFVESVTDFCAKPWADMEKNPLPNMETQKISDYCFNAAWVITLLHQGFGIEKGSQNFETVLKIHGEEIQWALGAVIYKMREFSTDSERVDISRLFWFIPFISILLVAILYLHSRKGKTWKEEIKMLRAV